MRIFVGYGYNQRDRWVETYAIPLIEAFGCEVVHGRAVFGGGLADEVLKQIRTSDALIGFTTRREAIGDNRFSTHPWVVRELTAAHSQDPPIPFVEVREDGVVSPDGLLESLDYQRIEYREEDRAACLVQIAQELKRFRQQTTVTQVRLAPVSAVEQIAAVLDDDSFRCSWQFLRSGAQSAARPIPVLPIGAGLYVQLRGIAADDLIRITISAGGRIWRSNYELLGTVDIQLKGKE